MLNIAYVRVSTDDQVEYSPEAQAKRARDFARLHDLGPVTVMADEGWSGKNLERPEMQRLLGLIEEDKVAHVIVWRYDRLARDSGDFNRLTRLLSEHCVQLHSIAEGQAELTTASGKMQLGVHGVFAQYYRDHIVENVTRAMEEGTKSGRHLNRAPTGYKMVNGALEPNDDADIVRRIFALRAEGLGFRAIEERTGIKYGTVRTITLNRVYCGYVRHRDEWYPGLHEPLVTEADFDAAQRAHTPGQRRSRDLLSGRVRCGLCERVLGVEYNDRGQAIYRCKHRGKGCDMPGRSAKGLHRAAVLGLDLLGQDHELQTAIRVELSRHLEPAEPANGRTVGALKAKRAKLLELYYDDKISPELFHEEERRLSTQLAELETANTEHRRREAERSELGQRFEEVAEFLAAADIHAVWDEATERERKTLIEDLVDAVYVYPDHLRVVACGAPPLKVDLTEVGLRPPTGMGPLVSEGGLEPPRP
ncbi:MAG: recombinase family protein [Microthrixaceae bacterium]